MRYVLNFNPEGTLALSGGDTTGSVEFKKLPRALASGATTKVRFVTNGGGVAPLTPRDEHGNRFGTVISETTAREAGLKGRKRYTLTPSGTSGWYNLVPHSNITRSRVKKIDGPGVSVSLIER